MKLLAHNFLTSNFLKGVTNGYPLILVATKKEIIPQEFNQAFVKRLLPKLDYPVLWKAAESIGEAEGLPQQLPEEWENDMTFLEKVHRLLVSVEVVEGELRCPETNRVFPIRMGIPNMLANEDEVA